MDTVRLELYYRKFHSSKESLSVDRLQNYYTRFPFSKGETRIAFADYSRFFLEIGPLIAEDRSEHSKNPPHLNVWQGFDLGRKELRHCSFLSWLLNPSANHCQGELFLTCFLDNLHLYQICDFCRGGWYYVSTEDYAGTLGRVDIFIIGRQFLIAIEAKIDALEQENQVSRIHSILENKAKSLVIPQENCKLIYLNREGSGPNTGNAEIIMRWADISNICKNFSAKCQNTFVSELVSQYAKFLTEEIV